MLAAANGAAQGRDPKMIDRSQARLEKEVRHEILMQPYYNVFDNATYRVDRFNVTLMGQVTRPVLKPDIENAAFPRGESGKVSPRTVFIWPWRA